jgi:trimeric autotransporter adhesin
VYPDLVAHDADGEVETVRYQELVPMLLNEVQEQAREITQLKDREEREIGPLEKRLVTLERAKDERNSSGDLVEAFDR